MSTTRAWWGDLMERMATVWCPDWPVTAAGCDSDTLAAVMRANRIVARTRSAADDGVVIGQRRRQAQQRCPTITLIDDDPARDAREFEPVVRAIADLAPRVDVVEPGWLSVAARGPSRYFGGDVSMARRLRDVAASALGARDGGSQEDHLEEPEKASGGADASAAVGGAAASVGADVGVGVADGRFAASVAARLSVRRREPVVIDPGTSPEFCAALPIGWLQTLDEIEPELVDLFVRLGLRRLGDLAALDPSDVLGRFGTVGMHAHRLASGRDPRPANTADPAPERLLDRVLDDPTEHADAVVFVAKQSADELSSRLRAEGRVCTRLVVLLETEHGERSERSWYRSAGLSGAAMVERVRWQLDAWINLPRGSQHEITGGITRVRLSPDEVRADHGTQLGLWGGQTDADRRAVRAIARLTTLTSESAVTVPVWNGGRLHTDRYRWMPATLVDLDQRAAGGAATAAGSDGTTGPWPGSIPAPSPATVFDEPIAIDVLDAQGAVVRVSGRGTLSSEPTQVRWVQSNHDGEQGSNTRDSQSDPRTGWQRGPVCAIRSWAGPWPVDQHWWEPERHRRLARFQMIIDRNAGEELACLVIAEHQRWFLAATYD